MTRGKSREDKRRFRGVADRLSLFAGNGRFGPVGSVREEDPREALRGRKSLQNRPYAEVGGLLNQYRVWFLEDVS